MYVSLSSTTYHEFKDIQIKDISENMTSKEEKVHIAEVK